MAKRHEKMLNVTNYQISANENHNEISPPEWLSSINQQTTSVREDVEKREPSCVVDGNADWCNHCGKQYGDTSKN